MLKKEAKNILKYKRPYNRNTANVERKNRIYASNNRDNWHHLKIVKKISKQKTMN